MEAHEVLREDAGIIKGPTLSQSLRVTRGLPGPMASLSGVA